MDNLDQLSDDELRRRLLQFGFPNLPVTSTTRKILIKKLRNYMDTERSKLRRETTHATRYSSDEDGSSDATSSTVSAATAQNNRRATRLGRSAARATIAGGVAPPTSIPEPSSRSQFARPATASTAKYQPTQHLSRMSPDLTRPIAVSTPIAGSAATAATARPASRSPTVYVSPMLQGSSGDDDTDEDTADFGLAINTSVHSGGGSPLNGQSSPLAGDLPHVSEYTKRLLNFRGNTVSKDLPGRPRLSATPTSALSASLKRKSQFNLPPTRIIQQPRTQHYNHQQFNNNNSPFGKALHNSGGGISSNNNSYSIVPNRNSIIGCMAAWRSKLISLGWPPASSDGKLNTSPVPFILHSLLIAFFVLVAIAYVVISPNLANTILAADTKHTPCTADLLTSGVPCIDSDALEPALQMVRRTAAELQRRAVDRQCRDATVKPHLSGLEVVRAAVDASGGLSSVSSIRGTLHDMAYLVHSNPQWGIQPCDGDGNGIDWSADRDAQNALSPLHFIIPNPQLSLKCKFYNKLQKFYMLVGVIALVTAIGYAVYAAYRFMVRRRIARKDTVDFLIADIIQALMERAAAASSDGGRSEGALIVINHLRDQLIMPTQRVSLQWAWNDAIRFLEANESRIHFEVGMHNGEDCQMMCWSAEQTVCGTPRNRLSAGAANTSASGSPAGSKSGSPAVKKWQSPAFDKVNKIAEPPTPCLKIRHMFESHEPVTAALQLAIQDAILEKVQHTDCRVFDVQLDAATCCVYVRCASTADAGIVHEQINGWWFDSRLVSIKFLHLERYVSRFPHSLGGPRCLQPSTTKMLSMSACSKSAGAQTNGNGGDEF